MTTSSRATPPRLILLRHAPAEHRDPRRWPDDDARPLRTLGKREFAKSAKGLTRLLAARGLSATSTLTRARETGEILGKRWGPASRPQLWEELRPHVPAERALERAARSIPKRGGDLILVGHEPQFSRLVGLAVTGEAVPLVQFSKGGAIAIEFESSVVPGGGKICWALTRSQLSRLANAKKLPARGEDV
jgi:phosphohistidine phosphatase